MKESALSKKFIKWLNGLPKTKAHKRYAGPGQKGKPDITGCSHGYRLEVETKINDNKPTLKQEWWMSYWRKTGAVVFWGNNLESMKHKFLAQMQDRGITISKK